MVCLQWAKVASDNVEIETVQDTKVAQLDRLCNLVIWSANGGNYLFLTNQHIEFCIEKYNLNE